MRECNQEIKKNRKEGVEDERGTVKYGIDMRQDRNGKKVIYFT